MSVNLRKTQKKKKKKLKKENKAPKKAFSKYQSSKPKDTMPRD